MRARRATGRPASGAGRAIGALVALAALALAVVIAVDAVRGGSSGEEDGGRGRGERVSGPETPPPGTLAGRLILALGDDCSLAELDLDALRLEERDLETGCRLWPDAAGERIAAVLPEGDRQELALVRLDGDEADVEARLGRLEGTVAWAPDGERLAWCDGRGTVSRSLAGDEQRLAGCRPAILADGRVATVAPQPGRRPPRILADGEPWLEPGAGLQAIADDLIVRLSSVGTAALPDGRIALAGLGLQLGGAVTGIELWRADGTLDGTIPLSRSPEPTGPIASGVRLDVSPTGDEVAVRASGSAPGSARRDALVALVDLRLGATIPVAAPDPLGVAWSPDGLWLAIATGLDVRLYGPGRGDPVYVLPVPARDVAWRD